MTSNLLFQPATYLGMGNSLQAQNNMSGAVQFYNYATILNPLYQEAIQSLLLLKCKNMTKKANEKSAEEIIADWVCSFVCRGQVWRAFKGRVHCFSMQVVNEQVFSPKP